jgi:hypothetical protein
MTATDLLCPRYLPIFPSHLQSLGRNAPISAAPNSARWKFYAVLMCSNIVHLKLTLVHAGREKTAPPKANRQRNLDELTNFSSALWRENFLLTLIHKKNTSKFKWMRVCWNSLGLLSRVVANATFAQSDFG